MVEGEGLGRRVAEVRENSSLYQKDFARRVGVSAGYLSQVERGKANPNLTIVEGIAREFPEINLRWLLSGIGSMLAPARTPIDTRAFSKTVGRVTSIEGFPENRSTKRRARETESYFAAIIYSRAVVLSQEVCQSHIEQAEDELAELLARQMLSYTRKALDTMHDIEWESPLRSGYSSAVRELEARFPDCPDLSALPALGPENPGGELEQAYVEGRLPELYARLSRLPRRALNEDLNEP